MQLAHQRQGLQLALPIEAVAALCFDGRGSVRREFPKVRKGARTQTLCRCPPQLLHRGTNPARPGDVFVSYSGNALLVLCGAAGGKNQVCVGVDKSRKNYAAAEIQFFSASRFTHSFDAAPGPDRRDPVTADQNCAVSNNSKLAKC